MSQVPLPERRYTVMVVPEGGRGQVRQITFTLLQLRRWAIVAAAVAGLALLAPVLLLTSLPRSLAWRGLHDENVALKGRMQDIERDLDEVDASLRRLRLYDAQLDALPPTANPLQDDAVDENAPLPEPDAPPPAAEEAPETSAPEVPSGPRPPDLGLDGQGGGDELDLPDDLTPTLQWALVLSERVRRTRMLLRRVLPQAGLLAESAEQWLANRDVLPSLWPVQGVITSRFGYRRSPFTRRWQFHSGIDIGAPIGTPVYAPADGVVIKTDTHPGFGRYLEIDHGGGVVSRLNHNSAILVLPGETVEAGQVVAQVGNTGMSTGPHCHYTILVDGEYQDPLLYLPSPDRPSP